MNSKKTFHLHTHYYSVELVGLITPVVVGISAYLFPDNLQWIVVGYPQQLMTVILLTYGLVVALLLILHEITDRNIYFNINRYLFVLLFIMVIVMTGGVNSSFSFLLIFPFIASIVYLDQKLTRNIGIFVVILYAAIIFLQPWSAIDPNLISKHLAQTALIGSIAFLMYRIVVETLHQKIEKEETDRRLEEIVHIDHLKSDFLSVAQHRLRTPLAGVRWALETLNQESSLAKPDQEIVGQSLERVKDSIEIVDGMLETAEGADDKSVSLKYKPTDLTAMIRRIADELDFIKKRNNTGIRLDMPAALVMEADEDKLYAALCNIIDNACRYTKNGLVNVSLTAYGEKALLKITDNGIGIVKSDMPHIFDRLHRGSNAIQMDPDESGVGLYVSKKVIELHGGTINIESNLEKGTKVLVELPLKRFNNIS